MSRDPNKFDAFVLADGLVDDGAVNELCRGHDRVVRALQALAIALSGRGPRPEALH